VVAGAEQVGVGTEVADEALAWTDGHPQDGRVGVGQVSRVDVDDQRPAAGRAGSSSLGFLRVRVHSYLSSRLAPVGAPGASSEG
jgi:hypothetical protein